MTLESQAQPAGRPASARFEERYVLGDRVGAGGMGEVRNCHDVSIGRDVAVKVIRGSEAERQGLLLRFVQEARLQAQLEHPSIVPVYDLGVTSDGTAYFTMKRIAGLTLREVLEGLARGDEACVARYSRRSLLAAFSRVCFTVAYAHDRGVVHRDLKPENVILGDYDEVYVLDWGVAKVLGDSEPEPDASRELVRDSLPDGLTADTGAYAILGTLGYMAPEQLTRGGAVDARADVYSLGALLYELLTLERLHAGTGAELAASTLEGAVLAPRSDLPEPLAEVIRRATELEPSRRLDSARALRASVEAYLDVDRDAERRRALAVHHVGAAERALASPSDADGAHRLRALRELNAALVLDPTHGGALVRLLRLLAELPSRLPAAVEAELASLRVTERARSSRRTALAYVAIGAVMVGIAATGTRAPAALLVIAAVCVVTAAHAWFAAALRTRTLHFVLSLVLKTAVTASLCVLFGPLVLVPSVLIAVALVVLVHQRASSSLRSTVLGVSMMALGLPLGLSLAGLLPSSYALVGEAFAILPWAVELTPGVALGVLSVATVMSLVIPILLVGSSIDALTRAEERFFAQAWYLERLIVGQPASGPMPAGTSQPAQARRVHEADAETLAATPAPNEAFDATVLAPQPADRALAETIPSAVQSIPALGRSALAGAPALALALSPPARRYVEVDGRQAHEPNLRCSRDQHLGREVLVQYAASPREPEAARALTDAARARGRLEHPGVLPVYDIGEDPERGPFFTVKRARGETLAAVLGSRGAAPAAERSLRGLLSALARACMTVAYAHSRGVVHGRLGCEQILLGEYDDVYVLGWSASPDPSSVDVRTGAAGDVSALGDVLGAILDEVASNSPLPELQDLHRRARRGALTARELHDEVVRYLDGERDRERRAELAGQHLARALAATSGQGDEASSRLAGSVTALREINTALALDPKNPEALRALVALLDDAPRRLPPEVVRRAHDVRALERSQAARRATWGYLAIIGGVATMMLTSARELHALTAIALTAAAAAAHTWWIGPARGRKAQVGLSVGLAVAVVLALGWLFGPLIMTPVVALAMASTQLVHARARSRVRLLVTGGYLAALFVPLLLQLLGAVEPVYSFEAGALLVRPQALAFHELGTPLLLAFATLLCLLVPAALVGRSIDALGSAERRQAAQASLLRRLLPRHDPSA